MTITKSVESNGERGLAQTVNLKRERSNKKFNPGLVNTTTIESTITHEENSFSRDRTYTHGNRVVDMGKKSYKINNIK